MDKVFFYADFIDGCQFLIILFLKCLFTYSKSSTVKNFK